MGFVGIIYLMKIIFCPEGSCFPFHGRMVISKRGIKGWVLVVLDETTSIEPLGSPYRAP